MARVHQLTVGPGNGSGGHPRPVRTHFSQNLDSFHVDSLYSASNRAADEARPVADSANNRRDWWSEIKRRGMFHVAGLYLVSAWLLVQIADVLSQGPLPMPAEALRLSGSP